MKLIRNDHLREREEVSNEVCRGNGSVLLRVIGQKFGDELQRLARDIDT